MIEGCLPTDEDELAEKVVGMIEMDLRPARPKRRQRQKMDYIKEGA
jgi:hypothetical protein